MPAERRGQVTHVKRESTGDRRNPVLAEARQGFHGGHEPDEARVSRPDL